MIISASRRTDIPAYYTEWFINRIKEEFVLVRNPRNPRQVSKINLAPDVTRGIVFWTKNPTNMVKYLPELSDYMYYFQFTLTSYGKDIEPNLPSKTDELIQTFKRLSAILGRERVIWRYDPILINEKYTTDYHFRAFATIAKKLSGSTKKVIISFIDIHYRNVKTNLKMLSLKDFKDEQKEEFVRKLVAIAHLYNLDVESCSGRLDLQHLGVKPARCIDYRLFEELLGCELKAGKDKNQRPECGCMPSIDIGVYNTCLHGCKYCYANYNQGIVARNRGLHDELSPLLIGNVTDEDKITARAITSFKGNSVMV